MAERKLVIGVDFGTKSGRAIVADVRTGEIVSEAVKDYAHGVMDRALPCGEKLPPDWALQHPADYTDVLETVVRGALARSGASAEQVIGLSLDFTASTVLPVDANGTPLCLLPGFENRPHAYVKLWKHHGAHQEAAQIDAVLKARGELDLPRYGGRISSELLLPKALQILHEDPELYEKAAAILEAPDWLGFLLTGERVRSGSTAGYKAMWLPEEGYPPEEFFAALDERMRHFVTEKLGGTVCPVGGRFGCLTAEWAGRLGLPVGTALGVSIIDAHAGMPGCGITEPGRMMLMLGTSSVQAVLSERPAAGKGVCGALRGGVMPGYYAIESGLAAVGDILGWFVEHCVPAAYSEAAKQQGKNIHTYLTELASALKPGESGLLALDWWNGNKTPFVDADLSGLLVGCTLTTRPEEIYRALIEATAFGTRTIMEAFEEAGVRVDEIVACGGIVEKNPLFMQIYADVTNRAIRVAASSQTAALGAAVYAASAAGEERGGYASPAEAARAMGRVKPEGYRPIPQNTAVYHTLYGEYTRLKETFGTNSVMHTLKALRKHP